MPAAATKYPRRGSAERGVEADGPNMSPSGASKGISWGKSVDEKEKNDHPILQNLVATYDRHGEAKNVLYLKEFRGKFKNKNPSKVVVKVEACTVSRMDCQIRRNVFHHHVETPHVPGTDMVGHIIQVGTKAKRYGFKVGDRVCALDLNLGGNARYVVAHSYQLIKVPPQADAAQVACLIRTYVTAYQCLYRAGDTSLRRGDKVLVIGGSGCVGQAVIQLAKVAGASEIYATGGEGNKSKAFIESLGAIPVGRQSWQWLPIVEGDMDIVIDSVCDDGYESSHKALNRHGKLVILGDMSRSEQGYLSYFLSQHKLHLNLLKASYTMERTTIYDLFEEYNEYPDQYERDLRMLFRMLEDGEIDPKIVKCIPLNEVANAHKEIEAGGVEGAIVCDPFSSSTAPHKKKTKSSQREEARCEADHGDSIPQTDWREEGDTSRGKTSAADVDRRKKSKVGALLEKPPSPLIFKNAFKQQQKKQEGKRSKRVSSKRMLTEDKQARPLATTSPNFTERQTPKKLEAEKKRAHAEAKRIEAEEVVARIRTEARRLEVDMDKHLGTSAVDEKNADEEHAEPKGILKESSYLTFDQAEAMALSIDAKVHERQQKAAMAAAAEVQAKRMEAELLKAEAEAKRAQAEAIKAKIEVRKAELALLKGK